METAKQRINMMTSCDENYAKLVPVQLVSIADNLLDTHPQGGYEVHFYLFHSRIGAEWVDKIHWYCGTLGIVFHEIRIADAAPYIQLASKGGGWSYEAYFSLECNRYLPPEVDRILYIDAADVLIAGDIGAYYFPDFDGCSLRVTCSRFKENTDGNMSLYSSDDLGNKELRPGILRGLFNSGSYVINVDKLRREQTSIADYLALSNALVDMHPGNDQIYFGDQGLLSAAFVGDIQYFAYPIAQNLWFQPYNFCIWFFDRSTEVCGGNPWYTPKILHFAGGMKPWLFSSENESKLKPGQWPFYKIYQLYANQAAALPHAETP